MFFSQQQFNKNHKESPITVILYTNKNDMMAELLELDNIVFQYLTEYVPEKILEQKFIDSIEKSKIQLEQRNNINDKRN